MQFPISGAPAPENVPSQTPAPPRLTEPAPRRARRRIWPVWLIFAALAGGAIYWAGRSSQSRRGQPAAVATAVPSVRLAVGELQQTIRLTGTTAAENYAGLRAPRLRGGRRGGGSGFTLELQHLATAGSLVKKGDLVAEFDRENMLNRLDDFKANVTQAESSIKTLRAELEVTRKTHEHSIRSAKADLDKARLDLKTIPVRSAIAAELLRLAAEEAEARYQQLLKEVKFMEDSLKAQLRIAELNRDESRVELKRLEADVDRALIRAPIDGLVVMQTTFRGGEQGQIQKGDQVSPGQPFVQIVDPRSMVANATANQVDSELIRIGAKARVRFDAYPNLALPAHVHAIGAMTKPAGWRGDYVKEVPVTLRLEQTDPRVIPDLSVSVDIVLASESRAVIASLESIFRDGPDGRPFVFLQRPSGWEERDVELGLVNHVAAVVRSGLSEGDIIALRRPATKAKE